MDTGKLLIYQRSEDNSELKNYNQNKHSVQIVIRDKVWRNTTTHHSRYSPDKADVSSKPSEILKRFIEDGDKGKDLRLDFVAWRWPIKILAWEVLKELQRSILGIL